MIELPTTIMGQFDPKGNDDSHQVPQDGHGAIPSTTGQPEKYGELVVLG